MITPDDLIEEFGADTLRLYEMFTGPLDQSRPWETKAVVGVFRLLQRIWRNVLDEDTGEPSTSPTPPPTRRRCGSCTARSPRCATAWRRCASTRRSPGSPSSTTTSRCAFRDGGVPREVAEPLVLMLAPLAPHAAEELWSRLGHPRASPGSPSPRPTPRCSSTTRSRSRCRSTARSGRGSRWPPASTPRRARGRRPRRRQGRRAAGRRHGPQGHRRPRQARQLRRRLTLGGRRRACRRVIRPAGL